MDSNTLVNIGVQRFDKLIEQGQFYIDKTDFIREWWEKGSEVSLITRPRRFGKTLNMSMLECFFPTNMQVGEICLRGYQSGQILLRGVRKNTDSSKAVSR